MKPHLLLAALLALPFAARADDTDKGKWVPISANVLAKVKPGYPGKTAGVAVDPATGDVYMVIPDQGIWKSTDRGETFARVVGRRRPAPLGEVPSAEARDALARMAGYRTGAPKGVFRYASHEAANADRDRWTVEAIVATQLRGR